MNALSKSFTGVALVVVSVVATGCSTVGKPMRFDPGAGATPAESWYIESKPGGERPVFSCSFVEFDGRGDYVDFSQHRAAWEAVKELGDKQPVLLVVYCHGWKNNSQSGDVVEFNSFLGRIAGSREIRDRGLRVHGVYLSWRGNPYRPSVDTADEEGFYAQSIADFGGPIVNQRYHTKVPLLWKIPENLSYWNRKRAAEHEVSGLPMARTIFACASVARHARHGAQSRVFVMGHSMGALILEQSLGQACVGTLADEWPWFTDRPANTYRSNPLPFDLVLFVNSAAPAIYAKEMRDFLSAHRSALKHSGVPHADAPVFISITSAADQATGRAHRLGNLFARCSRSMQRSYTNLLQSSKTRTNRPVHQSEFYRRTPGHHPLLVDHWIIPDTTVRSAPESNRLSILHHNLDMTAPDPELFYTSIGPGATNVAQWRITRKTPEEKWSRMFSGALPIPYYSSYWIVRCEKDLIRGHNDCWSTTTMQLYAALYRIAEAKRRHAPGVSGEAAGNANQLEPATAAEHRQATERASPGIGR